MQLGEFLALCEAKLIQDDEFRHFASVAHLYWEARLRGERGLHLTDVEEGQAEVLIQTFTYDESSGCYICPEIENLLQHKVPTKGLTEQQFETFWSIYPRKVAKAAARKVWLRKVKTDALAGRVIKALRLCIAHEWTGKETQFIPHAATWLNQERWEDEIGPRTLGGGHAVL